MCRNCSRRRLKSTSKTPSQGSRRLHPLICGGREFTRCFSGWGILAHQIRLTRGVTHGVDSSFATMTPRGRPQPKDPGADAEIRQAWNLGLTIGRSRGRARCRSGGNYDQWGHEVKIGGGMDGASEAQGCGTVAAVAAMWQPAMGGKMQCENVAPLRVGTEWLQSRLGTR